MNNLILIRHGMSYWNKAKRFTGWADIDLTEEVGKSEARRAGQLIKKLSIGNHFVLLHRLSLQRVLRNYSFYDQGVRFASWSEWFG